MLGIPKLLLLKLGIGKSITGGLLFGGEGKRNLRTARSRKILMKSGGGSGKLNASLQVANCLSNGWSASSCRLRSSNSNISRRSRAGGGKLNSGKLKWSFRGGKRSFCGLKRSFRGGKRSLRGGKRSFRGPPRSGVFTKELPFRPEGWLLDNFTLISSPFIE